MLQTLENSKNVHEEGTMKYEKLCIFQSQRNHLEIMAIFENNMNNHAMIQENVSWKSAMKRCLDKLESFKVLTMEIDCTILTINCLNYNVQKYQNFHYGNQFHIPYNQFHILDNLFVLGIN